MPNQHQSGPFHTWNCLNNIAEQNSILMHLAGDECDVNVDFIHRSGASVRLKLSQPPITLLLDELLALLRFFEADDVQEWKSRCPGLKAHWCESNELISLLRGCTSGGVRVDHVEVRQARKQFEQSHELVADLFDVGDVLLKVNDSLAVTLHSNMARGRRNPLGRDLHGTGDSKVDRLWVLDRRERSAENARRGGCRAGHV